MAAIPLRKSDADTAVVTGNFNRTKSGEKTRPPPSPTMVRMKDARKMITNNKTRGMNMILLSSNQHGRPYFPFCSYLF
jgi:hypothetical protein